MTSKQLSLWNDGPRSDDERPLPLIVAENWGFPLQYHVEDEVYWYSLNDWMKGLVGDDPRRVLNYMKRQGDTSISTRHMSYTDALGREYQREFVQAEDLYRVAGYLRVTKSRPVLCSIKDYLARCGVLVDEYRRNPDRQLADGVTRAGQKYERLGRPSEWVEARVAGTISRKVLTDAIRDALQELADPRFYGQATNDVYSGVFRRNSMQIRRDLGISKHQNPRDHMRLPALHALGLAESLCAEKLGNSEVITREQARELIQMWPTWSACQLMRSRSGWGWTS